VLLATFCLAPTIWIFAGDARRPAASAQRQEQQARNTKFLLHNSLISWREPGGFAGSGSPVNGIAYQNNSATDFGVNQDGLAT
jgi:hypothetical protein